jgi:hypothetical protein
MAYDDESIYTSTKYGPVVIKPADVSDYSLCDVIDDRILAWLDDKVQEEHFATMKEWGVQVVRIPTGYWNWKEMGDSTPNCPDDVATRYRNL